MSADPYTVLHGGDDWLIARFDGGEAMAASLAIQGAAAALAEAGGWCDIVPGIADLSVRFDPARETPGGAEMRLAQALDGARPMAAQDLPVIDIPVIYGDEWGPDLDETAGALGLTPEKVIGLHTEEPFLVQMMGFAPGFAYCGETPAALAAERLAEPRQRVAAGSVGIVGRQTCLYSLAGPGGWPLIGRTPLKLFDPGRDDPFLLRAGRRVKFRAIGAKEYERIAAKEHG